MAKKNVDYDAMDAQLSERTSESYDTKESSGTRQMALSLPSDIPLWNAGEGTHYIDIIPFFAGANNPQCKKGEATYVLDYWVHSNVGPAKETVVCLEKTFSYRGTPGHLVTEYGRRCPICEYRNKLIDEGADPKDKYIKALKAKRRVAYNVVVYDKQQEVDKGVQIWEVSHFFAEKNIVSISKSERTGAIIPFSSPRKEKGRTIKFERVGKGDNQAYQGFVLEPRDYDIEPDIMESALSLDEYLVYTTYDEVKEKFFDGLDEEGSEGHDEEAPAERKSGRVAAGRKPANEAFDPDAEAPPAGNEDEDQGPADAGEDEEEAPAAKTPPARRGGAVRGSEDSGGDAPVRRGAPAGRRGGAVRGSEDSGGDAPVRRGAPAGRKPAEEAPPARKPAESSGRAPVRRRPAQTDGED